VNAVALDIVGLVRTFGCWAEDGLTKINNRAAMRTDFSSMLGINQLLQDVSR
jgi:hypothetical protein